MSASPDWMAELDQAFAALGDMAKAVGTYHRDLVANGLTREEATAVVMGWQALMLSQQQGDAE